MPLRECAFDNLLIFSEFLAAIEILKNNRIWKVWLSNSSPYDKHLEEPELGPIAGED